MVKTTAHPLVRCIGVDPGASGGIAWIDPDGTMKAISMPDDEGQLWSMVEFIGGSVPCVASLEKVGGYIAGNKLPGSAMFNFGWSYGSLRMALTAAGIGFRDTTPQTWQKWTGLSRHVKETKESWKRRLRDKAQELAPTVQATLCTADAVLIALHLRDTISKNLPPPA